MVASNVIITDTIVIITNTIVTISNTILIINNTIKIITNRIVMIRMIMFDAFEVEAESPALQFGPSSLPTYSSLLQLTLPF